MSGGLTASILVAVVPTVVVPVTLPLSWDAGTLAKRADRTREVVPSTRTLCAALNSCIHTQDERVERQLMHFVSLLGGTLRSYFSG